MIRVVLNDGRVITYNQATTMDEWNAFYHLKSSKTSSVALISKNIVDRIEFEIPCSIRREKTKKELSRD